MLRIVGRRADGYHELQTVFQYIDLCDQLSFKIHQHDDELTILGNTDIPQQSNLIYKAARALQTQCNVHQGAEISVIKNIPLGAGLGGGSSDAATTLVALNQLWNTGLTSTELAQIGLQLGADVPVFIHGHAAWAEGVGEHLTSIELEQPWYLIIHPGCHVSTGEIFSDPELTRHSPKITIGDFLRGSRVNDCLSVVRKRFTQVADALDWLSSKASAQLTGTGACVFAPFPNQSEATDALSQLPHQWTGYVCQGLNRSPLAMATEQMK